MAHKVLLQTILLGIRWHEREIDVNHSRTEGQLEEMCRSVPFLTKKAKRKACALEGEQFR